MQLMTENVPGMIYRGVMRADGSQHMLYISPKVRELFEVEPEEALADFSKLSIRWLPDDIHLIKDCISNLCEKPDRFQAFEYRVILPKQGLRWRQAFGQASATEGGDTIFDVIVIDITDRKNTEIALQDAQSRIKGMAENIPGMVYQYLLRADGSHALTYVSSKCREMFEVEPEDALANADLLFGRRLPEDLEKVQEAIRVSAETLQPYQEETRFLLPKQGLCWRQINSEPRRLENGDTIWDGVVLDINDRKQTELALQEERAKFLQITDGNAS